MMTNHMCTYGTVMMMMDPHKKSPLKFKASARGDHNNNITIILFIKIQIQKNNCRQTIDKNIKKMDERK